MGKDYAMHSNLTLRILSAVVLAPLVFCAIWFGRSVYEDYSIPLYTILLSVLGMGLAWEWEQMFSKKTSYIALITSLFATLSVFLTEDNPSFALWLILLGTTLVFWLSRYNSAMAFGVLYICFPLVSMEYIYFINENISREIVLWLVFVVWATDIGGYVVGKTIGGPKVAPKISAKKTWAGVFGGVFFAMGVAYVFALYLKAHDYISQDDALFHQLTPVLVVSAGILALVSQVGDFFESFIKRRLNLKDSSHLIPGHGGLFDRVDGLLAASVVMAIAVFFANNGGLF